MKIFEGTGNVIIHQIMEIKNLKSKIFLFSSSTVSVDLGWKGPRQWRNKFSELNKESTKSTEEESMLFFSSIVAEWLFGNEILVLNFHQVCSVLFLESLYSATCLPPIFSMFIFFKCVHSYFVWFPPHVRHFVSF